MKILSTIASLMLGKIENANDRLTDENAISLLEREIRQAKEKLGTAQGEIAKLIGRRQVAQNKWSAAKEQYVKYSDARAGVEASGRADLLADLDTRLDTLESEGAALRQEIDQSNQVEEKLKANVVATRDQLRMLEQEIASVRATEAVHKAQETVARGAAGIGGSINSATRSLELIKERQAAKSAMLDASNEMHDAMTGGSLDRELSKAGLLERPKSGFGGSPRRGASGAFGTPLLAETTRPALPAPGDEA